MIDAPIAAVAGHRLLKEKLHWLQLTAGAVVVAGVGLTSLD